MTGQPYTDTDVQKVAEVLREAGMVSAFFDDSSGSWEVEQKTWQYEGAAKGVLDALTAAGWQPRAAVTGRCGHQMPNPIQAFGDATPIVCELLAGHAGWHRSGVTEWGAYMRRPSRVAKPAQVATDVGEGDGG
ncbi:hypothetical protein [Micromonospora sp. NPDC050695]|uniref:hypothetical protein n=1 Tax=Micromonospora sp. NPDC050695 TaxID=3154938 RepID=UPI00340384DA